MSCGATNFALMDEAAEQAAKRAEQNYEDLQNLERLVFNSTGKSDSWRESNVNVLRLFELFREYSDEMKELLPVRWFDLPEETLTEAYLYDCFLKFLLVNYIIEKGAKKGQVLSGEVASNYLNQLLHMGKRRWVSALQNPTGRAKFFFTCLEHKGTSEPAKWLQKTKRTVDHTTVSREIRKGAR